jgi:Ser/Thr protein kinase RdoA (MazF antagonist)
MTDLKNFTDDSGRIKTWAAKRDKKIEILKYISTKFESGRFYSQNEVNALIEQWHTFGDLFIIRRGLVDYMLLTRTRDGARYWKDEMASLGDIAALVEEKYNIGKANSIFCLSGGYGSQTYYVQSDKGAYILRHVGQNERNPEEYEALVSELKNGNVPVPEVIFTKDGSYCVTSENNAYQLRTFAEGKTYSRNSAPPWLLVDSACMLGRIQRCMEKLPPLPEGINKAYFQYFTPERAEQNHLHSLKIANEMHDTEIADAINNKIMMIHSLKKIDFDFDKLTCKNTHGDYKLQNIVCLKDKINSVIDFMSPCIHPVCWEVMRSYALADPECADGCINIENFKKYIACFLEYGTLNDDDLKLMPSVFFYQNVVADYFGQYYAMENKNRLNLLNDTFFSLKLCKWLEQNMTKLEDALIRGF